MIGAKYGRLSVIAEGDRSNGYVRWLMRCDCGTERLMRRNNIVNGVTTSCGCTRSTDRRPAKKPERQDLTGRLFGRLTVIKDSGLRNSQRRVLWACTCSCGNTKNVSSSSLVGGTTSSCGCLQTEQASMRKAVDLAGRRFGALTAISPSDAPDNAGYIRWNVRCDCGSEKIVRSNSLTQGEIISCGCAVRTGLSRDRRVIDRGIVREARRRALKVAAGGSFTVLDIVRLYRLQRGRCACCNDRLGENGHEHDQALDSRRSSSDCVCADKINGR